MPSDALLRVRPAHEKRRREAAFFVAMVEPAQYQSSSDTPTPR